MIYYTIIIIILGIILGLLAFAIYKTKDIEIKFDKDKKN
jgi:hypothetical protein